MFSISPQTMAAFDAEARRALLRRFCDWWHARSSVLGAAAETVLVAAYERHQPEAEFAGLNDEQEVFQFISGRFLIPNCEGGAYEALLDLVCDDAVPEAQRIVTISRWAGRRV